MPKFKLNYKTKTVITDDTESNLREIEQIKQQNKSKRVTVAATKVVSSLVIMEITDSK